MMTSAGFQKLATAMKAARPEREGSEIDGRAYTQWTRDLEAICSALLQDNPNFDAALFLAFSGRYDYFGSKDILWECSHVRLVQRGPHSFDIERRDNGERIASFITDISAHASIDAWNDIIKQEIGSNRDWPQSN